MGKHAFLIIAHNHLKLLNELLSVLDDPRNDIFLHIDKKAPDSYKQGINVDLKYSHVYFSERVNVHWGAFSQIESEIAVLTTATNTGHYEYYHLISGVDLPIKTQDQIHQFFDQMHGQELVQFQQPVIAPEKLSRVRRYAWFQEHDVRHNFFYSQVQRVTMIIQSLLKVNRIKKTTLEFQMGSNWFSITDDLARYVLAQTPKILPYFKHTQCADELFLQTIVVNSKYKDRLYHREFDDSKLGNMRFIEWVNHAPRDLTIEDFDILKRSELLFARKFNPDTDSAIIEAVLNQLARSPR
ncbi:beta-1,6-N-acetylglucosaminyltransferase [Lacticaseibacillus sp. GG6-2]